MKRRWRFEYRDGNHPLNDNGGWGGAGLYWEDGGMVLGQGSGWDGGYIEPAPDDAQLIEAAPEMFELIQQTASAIERGCANMTPAAQLAVALLQLRNQAKELLAKIEEGGE